ncbi:MAG: hypothetical protein O9308_07385 [Beijerinckiaceae bacterium]|nr:hypothetical protein [Beijerinckiaceae bacterium]
MSSAAVENCRQSVERIQLFDVLALVRKEDLGQLSFANAVDPAKRIVDFFKIIPVDHLNELPDSQADELRRHADHVFSVFDSILNFSALHNSASDRDSLIEALKNSYDPIFNSLFHLVSFLTSRQKDFASLERDARAAAQAAKDVAEALKLDLQKSKETADQILSDIRTTASEQGVSQKAIYFKSEAITHAQEANKWKNITIGLSCLMAGFATLSFFLHKIPILSPNNVFETTQIIFGKVLIAASIGYMLALSAKNFLSHKHNEVVNKHRQNALLTFNALVDATKDDGKRDVILQNAASCIFMPQETGYAKGGSSNDTGTVKLIEIAPKVSSTGS